MFYPQHDGHGFVCLLMLAAKLVLRQVTVSLAKTTQLEIGCQ